MHFKTDVIFLRTPVASRPLPQNLNGWICRFYFLTHFLNFRPVPSALSPPPSFPSIVHCAPATWRANKLVSSRLTCSYKKGPDELKIRRSTSTQSLGTTFFPYHAAFFGDRARGSCLLIMLADQQEYLFGFQYEMIQMSFHCVYLQVEGMRTWYWRQGIITSRT